ncbi:MAG: MFS transporter, partial [Elusimicrobia bacterium]|nr:MFS transporter [Elusimicrobiota bacterium]
MSSKSAAFLSVLSASLAVFIANLDSSIITVALPELAQAFGASVSGIAWLSLSYLLASASLLLVLGRLGDAKGPERVLAWGYGAFGLASVLCAAAPGFGWLVFFRLLQGGAAAALLATGLAVAARNVPPEMLGRALGAASVFGSLGFAAGPTLGGFIVEHIGWRWLFAINVPVAAAGIYTVSLLPRRKQEAPARIDVLGAALSCCALGCLVYALNCGLGASVPRSVVFGAWLAA